MLKNNLNKKIKISFIISNLGQGGAERQFVELIKYVDKNRFEIDVCLYAVNKGIFYREIEKIENIRLMTNVLTCRNKIFKILEALKYIRRYLTNNHFDIVQTTLFMNGLFVRVIAPKSYKNHIVSTIRNSLLLYTKKHLLAEKFLLSKSFVVSNTRQASEDFKRKVNKKLHYKISYIYNGFDVARFSVSNRENNERLIVGSVGRMSVQKNQIQLLRVFCKLDFDNISLQIIGSRGDQTQKLINYKDTNSNNKKIDILDPINEIENQYKQFTIFVLPSLFEGCPNVLFEAMLSKCFCIISKGANTDDFIIDGKNGLVYDGTDIELKKKLEFAIKIYSTQTFNNIIEDGYIYAKENFTVESMVNKYENIYIKIYEANGK